MTNASDKRIDWDKRVEALARFLCEEKGRDPDAPYTLAIKNWQTFADDAEAYLRRRVLNKYYWENLSGYEY